MSWCISQPVCPRGFEVNVGVQTSCDCLVDNALSLLFEQGDEPLFGADVAVDELVGVVEVADDGGFALQVGELVAIVLRAWRT